MDVKKQEVSPGLNYWHEATQCFPRCVHYIAKPCTTVQQDSAKGQSLPAGLIKKISIEGACEPYLKHKWDFGRPRAFQQRDGQKCGGRDQLGEGPARHGSSWLAKWEVRHRGLDDRLRLRTVFVRKWVSHGGVFDLSMWLLACGTVPGGHTQEENYPQTCSWLLYSDASAGVPTYGKTKTRNKRKW